MRDLAILTFVTLDGVMQAPSMPEEDRSGGFQGGGWAAPYWPEVMEQVQREAMDAPYDMLFGRKTYELFAGHWTTVEGDAVAQRMNAAKKYVVTSTLSDLNWANSNVIAGDIERAISNLKKQTGPLLQIHGSWQLIQFLLAKGLVDQLRLWMFPVVVGPGKRLFGTERMASEFDLVKSDTTGNGVVMAIYRRR
jgi:dihydrofolate reductase